jgi:hypothetical protein
MGVPLARICVLYDVLNKICINGLFHPCFVSKEDATLDCIENRSSSGVLMLFDRGYPSYRLIYMLLKRNPQTHFVMRVQKNFNNPLKAFITSDEQDITVDIFPPYTSRKRLKNLGVEVSRHTPIKVHMVKVLPDTGETEVPVTDLYDPSLYSREHLKEVYFLRWGIETFYGHAKNELQLAQFSGIRSICIEQDFVANLFLLNLQSLIEKQTEPYVKAVGKKRKYACQINKNISWASLKYRAVLLFFFARQHSRIDRTSKFI